MNIHDMVANNQEVLVQNVGGVLVADSLQVAECFGKRHEKVMRDIENIKYNLLVEFSADEDNPNFGFISKSEQDFFIPSTYTDSMNRERKKYLLTRDGFSLLVMGFTGTAALHWKLLYIEAFNKMEAALRKQNTPQLEDLADLITQISTQVAVTIAAQLVEQLAPLLTGQTVKEVVVTEPKSLEARPCMRRIEFLKGNRDALPNLLTVYDVRDFLGVGQKFAYELIHKDGFPAKKIGTSYQIPKEDFLKWYDKQGKEGN